MTRPSFNRHISIGLIAVIVVGFSLSGAAAVSRWRQGRESLPYYGSADRLPHWSPTAHQIGAFSLTTQTGATLTDRDLAGQVYVASFIYTRCSMLCPTLVRSLAQVQERVRDPRFLVLSFSVTPDLDTPAVLATFGREHRIDPGRWKLLTGQAHTIRALARDSFFASDERLRTTLGGSDAFLHTEALVLVDATGRIRGLYNGTQRADLDHLVQDAGVLLNK